MRSRRMGAALCCALVSFSASGQEAAPEPVALVPPRLLERVEPRYPDEARKKGVAGTVILALVVDEQGQVADVRLVERAGHGLDEAAIEAARRLRFAPATQGGMPVRVQINYAVHFELARLPLLEETVRDGAAGEPPPYELVVEGERPFTAASSRMVRDRDFLLRPRFTPEDILRVVPGLVLAQHQGGGKADQLFLRGFDADHGTDVAVNLDGIPVNMPSHAHGQGYTDLHFLIPEAIERVEITKGPYFAEHGDFDTAGAVNLVTRKRFEKSQVTGMGGLFPTLSGRRDDGTSRRFAGYRVLGIASPDIKEIAPFFAAEVSGTGGPFLASEKLQRYNLFAKATAAVSQATTISFLATAYASSWVGSGQIPARLVDAGVIDRYGGVDPTEGGSTQRQQAILSLSVRPDSRSTFTAALSAVRYGLTLFNDFTFQSRDQTHGDAIEQDDRRTSLFANLKYERIDRTQRLGTFISTLGAQYRSDDIDASLFRVEKRVRLPNCGALDNPCVSTNDRQSDAAAYLQEDYRPFRFLRIVVGLRTDLFEFDVRSLKPGNGIDASSPAPLPPSVQRSIVSPKASAVLTPIDDLDLYLNFGAGFHSNDARSAIETNGAGALPRAIGYEVGTRARLLGGRLDLAAALWRLDLDSELVFSGDEGGTSPSDSTRREGVDLEARYQILGWLSADADVSLARSRFKADSGNGNAVALAPPRIVTAGLTAHHPSGFRSSLRLRHIGERPGSQLQSRDGVPPCTPDRDASTAEGARCYLVAAGYTVVDATMSYLQPRYSITLLLENLTDARYREAQFGNVSRVIAPPPRAGPAFVPESHDVQDIHYTPGNPFGVYLATTFYF